LACGGDWGCVKINVWLLWIKRLKVFHEEKAFSVGGPVHGIFNPGCIVFIYISGLHPGDLWLKG
jgi:hypothetical protein